MHCKVKCLAAVAPAAGASRQLAAYRGLVIVGSPSTLHNDEIWYQWLAWVRSYKAILHPAVIDDAIRRLPKPEQS